MMSSILSTDMDNTSTRDVYQTISPQDLSENLKNGFKYMPLSPPPKKSTQLRNIQPSFFEKINPGVKNRVKAMN
tara:strand:+ start:383 stop:604 length:222 start_codon:yes stop_codon:yes gene_type:complete